MERAFPAGVYFIGLQAAKDPDLMWATIAEVLDATGDTNLPPADRVSTFLSRRQALLVLDNLEQIVDADHVVAALLSAAPLVSILATSRRSLHLVGENEYPVPPLALPEPGESDPDRASRTAAVEMFVQHAQMVRPSFQLTGANTADVLAVCRRLDGLPLAIELAAARARLLSPRALLNHIDDRLGTGVTAADRPERQRTLGATIAWSYDLLEPFEQQVFRRLGVFSSSADLDAIAAVAGDGSDDPLDTIGRLVDANLVYVTEEADGEPHAALLETIRRFARDRLDDAGEGDEVRLRHLRWCIDMASRTSALLRGAHHMTALDQMSVIENDVRAALDWSLSPAETLGQTTVEAGHELLGLMTRYWYRFGNVAEARGWQERGVATSDGADTESNVTLLHGLGVSMLQQNEVDNSFATFERSLQMARRLGHREFETRALNDLAIANRQCGNYSEAMLLMSENLALAREIDDPTRVATALSNLVVLHIDVGEHAEAVRIAQESIAANERNGDAWGVAIDRLNYTAAILKSEGPEAAFDRYVEWAEHIASFGDNELTIDLAELGASIHAGLGQPEVAARLLGSAESQRDRSALRRSGAEQTLIDEWIVPARSAIDPAAWDDAYAAGRELSPTAAIELAIRARSPSTP
jgi:predicted ATPase